MTVPTTLGGVTTAGLPYPGPADALTDTDRFIRELAQACDTRLSSTGWAYYAGPIRTNSNGDISVDFSASLATVNGYRVQSGIPNNPVMENVLWMMLAGPPPGVIWVRCVAPQQLAPLPNRDTVVAVLAFGNPR